MTTSWNLPLQIKCTATLKTENEKTPTLCEEASAVPLRPVFSEPLQLWHDWEPFLQLRSCTSAQRATPEPFLLSTVCACERPPVTFIPPGGVFAAAPHVTTGFRGV